MIGLVPVGDAPATEIAALVPVLRETFGVPVVVSPAIPLPAEAYDQRRRQYRSRVLLDALARARPAGSERVLGVADVDLFTPDLNFVFGEADPSRGLAVFSLVRLRAGSAIEELFRRRAATESVHELGHTYGLGHCRDQHCVMWFSNTLSESDRKGTGFCAAHVDQLSRARADRR